MASLKDDSSDSGRSQSSKVTFPATAKTPHWRIENDKNKKHKPAPGGTAKIYVRVRFRYDETRYCKIKYNKSAESPKPTDSTNLDELAAILKDSELKVLKYALFCILEAKCKLGGIQERVEGAVKQPDGSVLMTVPITMMPPVGAAENLNGCAQIMIVGAD